MIRINLLPYRTERRQNQIIQHVAVLLGVVLITGLVLFAVDALKTSELTALENEFSDLKSQNAALQKKIGKIKDLDQLRSDVERKLELVDRLQQGRFESLVTLNGISELIPENVWLTQVTDTNGTISLSGLGESNKAVANFMRALDQSELFNDISLKTIARVSVGNIPVRNFSLTMTRIVETKKKTADKPGGGR